MKSFVWAHPDVTGQFVYKSFDHLVDSVGPAIVTIQYFMCWVPTYSLQKSFPNRLTNPYNLFYLQYFM